MKSCNLCKDIYFYFNVQYFNSFSKYILTKYKQIIAFYSKYWGVLLRKNSNILLYILLKRMKLMLKQYEKANPFWANQNGFVKNLFICKPDFVPPQYQRPKSWFWTGVHHLSTSAVADEMYLPTPRTLRATKVSRQNRDVAVYVAFQPTRFTRLSDCSETLCALTAHFHPYPDESGRLFSVALSVPNLR